MPGCSAAAVAPPLALAEIGWPWNIGAPLGAATKWVSGDERRREGWDGRGDDATGWLMAAEIKDVLSIVVGSATQPPWLEERLRQMARTIVSFREGEDRAPRRVDARKRFESFRDAVLLIREEMTDPAFEVYFRQFWTTSEIEYHPVLRVLEGLGNKAGSLSMELAARGGATRAYPTDPETSISARELCAWVIVQALQRTRLVTSIGADNEDAQEAANLLWQICGGDPLGDTEAGRLPTGWRSHIISVKEAERAGDQRSAWLASIAETFEALVLVPRIEIS